MPILDSDVDESARTRTINGNADAQRGEGVQSWCWCVWQGCALGNEESGITSCLSLPNYSPVQLISSGGAAHLPGRSDDNFMDPAHPCSINPAPSFARLLIKSVLTIDSWANYTAALMAASPSSLLLPRCSRVVTAALPHSWKQHSRLMCGQGSNISQYNISLPESISIAEIKGNY